MGSETLRLSNGTRVQDGLEITKVFLEWYIEYLQKTEPYAKKSINLMKDALEDMPYDIEELKGGK